MAHFRERKKQRKKALKEIKIFNEKLSKDPIGKELDIKINYIRDFYDKSTRELVIELNVCFSNAFEKVLFTYWNEIYDQNLYIYCRNIILIETNLLQAVYESHTEEEWDKITNNSFLLDKSI